MGKYFGTDGFRGEANVKLTVEHAYKIGRFIGERFRSKGVPADILIGKDTRCSGDMLEAGLVAGITASGSCAHVLFVTTTPAVSHLVKTGGFDCGVMISASHNPYYDNGIKLIAKDGKKVHNQLEESIEYYIDGKTGHIPFSLKDKIGRVVGYSDGNAKYLEHLRQTVDLDLSGLRIGLDCANGGASALAPGFFEALGAQVYVIGCEPDGKNINEACGSTHIEALQELVKRERLDVGFAFDGDADRCIAVDENAEAIDGDRIMFVCGKYFKEQGRLKDDTVVTTLMSNLGLHKAFEREGIRTLVTDVGDRHVAERMSVGGYSLGGEQSGHIIFGEYASSGDGMLTALMTLDAIRYKGASLGELAGEINIYPQILKNVRVKDKSAVTNNKNVLSAIERTRSELEKNGRVIVRESGTEPLIRVMAEAETDEICKRSVDLIVDTIKSEGLEE